MFYDKFRKDVDALNMMLDKVEYDFEYDGPFLDAWLDGYDEGLKYCLTVLENHENVQATREVLQLLINMNCNGDYT